MHRTNLPSERPDYWATYRDRIRAVTADDVLRVAQKYLQPDKLVVLVVGNIDEITKGNPDKPQYTLTKIAKDGTIKRIPLPDPLTLVYPEGAVSGIWSSRNNKSGGEINLAA